MARSEELVEIQQRLRKLIVAPSGVAAALQEWGEPAARALDDTVRSDAKLAAVERLEIYANAYFYRIHDALCEDFAALRAALGEAHFHDLVTAYLIAQPPRHPSLRYAGDRLANFFADASSVHSLRERLPWGPDLARLEWAIIDAFDAQDTEAVTREQLAAVEPERWVALGFEFQPALQRLSVNWPVARVRRAWDGDEPLPESLEEQPARILVWRHEERVGYRTLDDAEALALELAVAGRRFGELCEALAQREGDDEAPSLAAAMLARWQADGLIRRLC